MGWRGEVLEFGSRIDQTISSHEAGRRLLIEPFWAYDGDEARVVVSSPRIRVRQYGHGFMTTLDVLSTTQEGDLWTWHDRLESEQVPVDMDIFPGPARLPAGRTAWLRRRPKKAPGLEVHLFRSDGTGSEVRIVESVPHDKQVIGDELFFVTYKGERYKNRTVGFTKFTLDGQPTATFDASIPARVVLSDLGSRSVYVWWGDDAFGVASADDGTLLWSRPKTLSDRVACRGTVVVIGRGSSNGKPELECIDVATGDSFERLSLPFTSQGYTDVRVHVATDGDTVMWHAKDESKVRDRLGPPRLSWLRRSDGLRGDIELPTSWLVSSLSYETAGFFVVSGRSDRHYPEGLSFLRGGCIVLEQTPGDETEIVWPSRPEYTVERVPRATGKHSYRILLREPDRDRLIRFAWVLLSEAATEYGYYPTKDKKRVDREFDGKLELRVERGNHADDLAVWLDYVVKRFERVPLKTDLKAGDRKTPVKASWKWA